MYSEDCFRLPAGRSISLATPEETMRLLIALAATACLASPVLADTCSAQATTKKLHGAAETSFVKKCTSDAKVKCDADAKAKAKNLHGAAQTSFTAKCVKDAAGA
jgi:hypothetical protein